MKIEDLDTLWVEDSRIDPSELGMEALRIEQLHARWLKLLSQAKRECRQAEHALTAERLLKYEFYTNGPTRESRERGWRLPAAGKLLKSEAMRYVDADPDVLGRAMAAGDAQDAVAAVTDKLKMIAFRGNRISDAIKWQLFISGK